MHASVPEDSVFVKYLNEQNSVVLLFYIRNSFCMYSSFNRLDSCCCCCNRLRSTSTSIMSLSFCCVTLSSITSSLTISIIGIDYLVFVAISVLDERVSIQWTGLFGNSVFHCWMIRVLNCLESSISLPDGLIVSIENLTLDKRSKKAERNLLIIFQNLLDFWIVNKVEDIELEFINSKCCYVPVSPYSCEGDISQSDCSICFILGVCFLN